MFRPQDGEAFDFQYDDYNPFCTNNRDPGATGSTQCSDFPLDPITNVMSCNKGDVTSVEHLTLFFSVAMGFFLM